MSAVTIQVPAYVAFCSDCDWVGPVCETVTDADRDAERHDRNAHGEGV